MAGLNLGALSPIPSPQAAAQSRTKRYHGAFILAGLPAVVTSTRRRGDPLGVALELGNGAAAIRGEMSDAQARAMARALLQAADAACAPPAPPQALRQPCRWGHDADVLCPDCAHVVNTARGVQ